MTWNHHIFICTNKYKQNHLHQAQNATMLSIQIAAVHVQCARISMKNLENYDLGTMDESNMY